MPGPLKYSYWKTPLVEASDDATAKSIH